MRCFSRMLISNVHKSIIVMNSIDTRFSWNVFEAVLKTRSTCFIGSKTTRLRLVVLNPIKHWCSFIKHYVKQTQTVPAKYPNVNRTKQWNFVSNADEGLSKS